MPSVKRGRRRAADRDALVSYKLTVARELLLRQLADALKTEPVLSSPATVREWLQLYCANLGHEVFVVLALDSQNRLIDARELFRGTLSQTSVYPREVVKYALTRNAAAVMFAHNHPSGVAEPSRADELLTQSLKQSLALIDVRVLDHFVVAGTSTVSFAERGLI
jgi:DNA repair protein RadC